MELSIVIPIYRSEKTIRLLVEKLQSELKELSFEVILVNDGSPDNSEKICSDLVKQYRNVKFISLRRNFGEFNAVMAGLHYVSGDYAVMIDDDFQNPPSEIIKLLEKAKSQNFDVVYSEYADKKHSMFRNFGSWAVNKMNNILLDKPKDLYLSSFKIIKKEVVEEIINYTGSNPYIDALIFRVTNNVGSILVDHHARIDGKSSYTFKKLVSLFLSILFGYSTFPIRFCWAIGMLLILVWFMLIFVDLFTHQLNNQSVILLVSILVAALQFIFLGILGEYIGRNFMQQGGKLQFVIKKIEEHKAD